MRRRRCLRRVGSNLPAKIDDLYDLFEATYVQEEGEYDPLLAKEVLTNFLGRSLPMQDLDWWMRLLTTADGYDLSRMLNTKQLKDYLESILLEALDSNLGEDLEPDYHEDYPGQRYPEPEYEEEE